MDPILEEEEPTERTQLVLPKTKRRPHTPISSPSSRKASVKSTTQIVSVDSDYLPTHPQLSPRSQRRIFDAYAFTPSREIPRAKFTDQPPAVLWPPPQPKQCNYVFCPPELDEQYIPGHQNRPSLTKAQSTIGVDVEAELLRLTPKKGAKPGGPLLRSVSLKVTEPPISISLASSTAEHENLRPGSPSLGNSRRPSFRKAMLRAKTLPVENDPQHRVSLVPGGIRVPAKWGQVETSKPIPKPYETRFCSGCQRYITLTKTQYVCNDVGCDNRMCDQCYNMWLDAKWEGRGIVTPEKLQKAYTAAEFRERYAKGMLQNDLIPRGEKARYIGEAVAGVIGRSFRDVLNRNQEYKVGRKTDPARLKHLNLKPLKEIFGEEEVEMMLLRSSETKGSSITADVGPGRPASDDVESSNGSGSVWGWDYASGKRDAAAAGRTVPALPQADYQPPTFSPPSSPSTSSISIISASETVVGRAVSQRSSSPSWTLFTASSSDYAHSAD